MAVLGNPLKRAVRLQFAGQTAFSPIGNISLHFLESVGVALRYNVIFFLRNELYFHAIFHTFEGAQMSNSWMRIRTWNWYEYGKTKRTLFAHELSSDQGCIPNIHGGTQPPSENICGAAATLFLSCEVKILWVWLPISSPLRAWLPWPFSRGGSSFHKQGNTIDRGLPAWEGNGRAGVGEAFKKKILLTSMSEVVLDL